jgi:hypothetical protein
MPPPVSKLFAHSYALALALIILLDEQSPSCTRRQPDTAATSGPRGIITLERLNAPAAKTVYTPINDDEIRLVTIHCRSDEDLISCSLSIASGDNLPDYEALSYVCKS